MNVLVACEFSGVVREAFRARGHAAWSADLEPAEDGSPYHFTGDIIPHLVGGGLYGVAWDLFIAHPPCTRLCNSGVRWLSKPPAGKTVEQMQQELDQGAALFSACWNAGIPKVCIENPVMHRYAKARIAQYEPFAQSIQPWQFGHGEVKRTCLWLRGLPPLRPTHATRGNLFMAEAPRERVARVHREPPSPDRWKNRSRTFIGIAEAMADQWGVADMAVAS